MLIFNNIFEELNNLDDDDFEDEDYRDITESEKSFAQDIFNLIQTEINKSDDLDEEFTSNKNLIKHFKKHCYAKDKSKQSTKTKIFYDFKDISQYIEYERKLHSEFFNAEGNTIIIGSLLETDEILKGFRKLFEGNYCLTFNIFCGFKNATGGISIAFHAFASNVTKNYKLGNTIDIAIISHNKTITLYPIDAYYLETKFNSIIKKYNDLDIEFKFNH